MQQSGLCSTAGAVIIYFIHIKKWQYGLLNYVPGQIWQVMTSCSESSSSALAVHWVNCWLHAVDWTTHRDRWKHKSQLDQIFFYKSCCQTVATCKNEICVEVADSGDWSQTYTHTEACILYINYIYSQKIQQPVTPPDVAFLPTAFKSNEWVETLFLESRDMYTLFTCCSSFFPAEDF